MEHPVLLVLSTRLLNRQHDLIVWGLNEEDWGAEKAAMLRHGGLGMHAWLLQ